MTTITSVRVDGPENKPTPSGYSGPSSCHKTHGIPPANFYILIRRPEVLRITGLSQSSMYELINAGAFPKPIPLFTGSRSMGWVLGEVEEYVANRICHTRCGGQCADGTGRVGNAN